MAIFNEKQQRIAERIDSSVVLANWKDWRWQLKHAIRDIDTMERLLGIEIEAEQKKQLETTVQKFPLSVTPYYLSLIDKNDYVNDPVYKQSVPNSAELEIQPYEMRDPLGTRTVPCPTSRIDILIVSCSM